MKLKSMGAALAAMFASRPTVVARMSGRLSLGDLQSIFTAAHFSPQRGFEHTLARRSKCFRPTPTTYFAPEKRHGAQECARRLKQNGYAAEVERDAARYQASFGWAGR